jgi:hypothetical protein
MDEDTIYASGPTQKAYLSILRSVSRAAKVAYRVPPSQPPSQGNPIGFHIPKAGL